MTCCSIQRYMVLIIKQVPQPCCFPSRIETFTKDVKLSNLRTKSQRVEREIERLFSGRIIMIWFYLYRTNWKEFSGMQGLVSFDALNSKWHIWNTLSGKQQLNQTIPQILYIQFSCPNKYRRTSRAYWNISIDMKHCLSHCLTNEKSHSTLMKMIKCSL